MIAPFWDDIILSKTGIVEYGIVTSATASSDINKVEAFLRLNQNISVELDWVLVAKWVNVCPYGNNKCTQVINHNNILKILLLLFYSRQIHSKL